jgi:hypothetical protein
VAYVLNGRRDDHGMHDLLDTIPVLPAGWTDQAEVRQLGERWMRMSRSPRPIPDTAEKPGTGRKGREPERRTSRYH